MFRIQASLALALLLSSCMSFSDRPLRPLADSLRQQNPAISLEKEMAFNMGSALFNILGSLSPDSAELADVESVQLAVYKVSGQHALAAFNEEEFRIALQHRDADLQWERIVRVNEEDERVWIYAGMDIARQRLAALSVFTLDREELVLMRVRGDLDQLLRFALRTADDSRPHRERRTTAQL